MLHHNRELFEELILRVSLESGIDAAIVEKDYYVSLLLYAIRETVYINTRNGQKAVFVRL